MKHSVLVVSLALCSLGGLPAQQLHWQVAGPSGAEYKSMREFVDYNHDGYRDYLRTVYSSGAHLQIASGLDGSTLWSKSPPPGGFHAGDIDGDGEPDLINRRGGGVGITLEIYSPHRDITLWSYHSPWSSFGSEILGNIDVTGDGRPDVITKTFGYASSEVFVLDTDGNLIYSIPCLPLGRFPASLADMGDMDGDGCDDFLIGCVEPSGRGLQWLISGKTGSTIRETYGLLPGDHTSLLVCNLGDIDGDGTNDYAGFPWYTSLRSIAVAYSGATGAVIRSWDDRPNSVVSGEDFDQDGVPDLVTGGDWFVGALLGRTLCFSGRDGSELWRVDVVPFATGINGGNWMVRSASLGVQPSSPYPVVAWLDPEWYDTMIGGQGRIRAYGGARAGQGPVTGVACTSSGTLPLIGVRKLGAADANTGFRTTVAKTHANALAALNFAFAALPMPVDLAPFGFAGCTAYVDPAAVFLQVTGTTGIDRGYAAVDLPHPLSAATTGTDVVAQWLVLEPATAAFAATQMHAIRLP